MPKVSVLTSLYNTNLNFLKKCIDSVLIQTFSDFEFIILNDSPDNVELDNVVLSYSDNRIIYLKNEKNMGISWSRNRLLLSAKGEYIAVLDHDDVCVPERLQLQAEYLDKHSEVVAVSGQYEKIGKRKWISCYPENDIDIRIALTDGNCMPHTALMMRRNCVIENGVKYNGYYSPAEDYDLVLQLAKVGKLYNFPDVLVQYRSYASQVSNKRRALMKLKGKELVLRMRNEYPAYWEYFKLSTERFRWRINLFGMIPLLKLKKNWIYLFGFIPLFKIKWSYYDELFKRLE